MTVTVQQVESEVMKLTDLSGNRCYATRADMRRHYSLQAIANECAERSVTPAQTSKAFWNIVSRFSY